MKYKNFDITSCPLSGVGKAVGMIPGAYILVIGTEECTYYTKYTLGMKGFDENCFSVILDNNDVTFGSMKKVTVASYELLEEYEPKSLFLVTTCVVEIIGDDFNALAEELSSKFKIPVKVIQTEHYTGKDGQHGMDLVLNSTKGTRHKMNKFGMALNMAKNKLGNRSNMSEEQMFEMMKAKTGGRMSDDEIRQRIKSKSGGRR